MERVTLIIGSAQEKETPGLSVRDQTFPSRLCSMLSFEYITSFVILKKKSLTPHFR